MIFHRIKERTKPQNHIIYRFIIIILSINTTKYYSNINCVFKIKIKFRHKGPCRMCRHSKRCKRVKTIYFYSIQFYFRMIYTSELYNTAIGKY